MKILLELPGRIKIKMITDQLSDPLLEADAYQKQVG